MCMETNLISIGNSKGVRIPKAFLKECDFSGGVDLSVKKGKIILSALEQSRANWEQMFKQNATAKADTELLDFEQLQNKWDEEDWEWK